LYRGIFTYVLIMYLRFTPSILLPHPPPPSLPLLRTISADFIFLFSYKYSKCTVYWPYLLSFTCSIYLLPPTGVFPPGRTWFTFLSFIFKYILIAQGGFLIFHTCISLIRLTPPLLNSFFVILLPCYSTAFNAFC
jgi:hypothetical protein